MKRASSNECDDQQQSGQAAHAPIEHGHRAGELAEDGGHDQGAPQSEDGRAGQAGEIHSESHQDEEERDEKARQRVHQLREGRLLVSGADALAVGV